MKTIRWVWATKPLPPIGSQHFPDQGTLAKNHPVDSLNFYIIYVSSG